MASELRHTEAEVERLAAAVAQSAAGGAAKHAFPEAQVPETIWSKMLSWGDWATSAGPGSAGAVWRNG